MPVPVSGNSINLDLPANKLCSWSFFTLAANEWHVVIKDGNGNVLLDEHNQGIKTAGKCGWINTNDSDTYNLTFTSNGREVQMLYSENPINIGNNTYVCNTTFIGEDSTDSDYNDITFNISCYKTNR